MYLYNLEVLFIYGTSAFKETGLGLLGSKDKCLYILSNKLKGQHPYIRCD